MRNLYRLYFHTHYQNLNNTSIMGIWEEKNGLCLRCHHRRQLLDYITVWVGEREREGKVYLHIFCFCFFFLRNTFFVK